MANSHRGISPAIGILVTIMIAVVGGTATAVYAQELFDAEQIAIQPKIESAKIVGYDARDGTRLQNHNGIYTTPNSAGTVNGKIAKTERIGIYFQNDSVGKIWIQELRFAGTVYNFAGESNNIDDFTVNEIPKPGEYVILSNNPNGLVTSGLGALEGGELVTIILGVNEDIKIDRYSQLKITSTNGFVVVATINLGNYHGTSLRGNSIGFTLPPVEIEEVTELPVSLCNSGSIDFETDALGNPLPAGTIVGSQWHLVDIHISAINNQVGHPNKVIIFDSNNPTGGDWDLGSPWDSGNLPPDTDLGNFLIIAEDRVDSNGDGLVDDPDDEAKGGTIIFQSINSCSTLGFDFIDFEEDQGNSGYVIINLEGGGSIEFDFRDFVGPIYGDNSANRVSISSEDIGGTFKRVEFHFIGSGAIDNVLLG